MVTGPNEPDPLPSNTRVLFGTFGTSNGTNQLGYDPAQWSHTGVAYVHPDCLICGLLTIPIVTLLSSTYVSWASPERLCSTQ